MQLFTRRTRLSGPRREVLPYAIDMCGFECEITEHEVTLWSAVLGAPHGTWFSTMTVDGIADVASALDRLADDNAYQTLVTAGRQFVVGGSHSSLARVEFGTAEQVPIGGFAAVTSVAVASGRTAAARDWAVDLAEAADAATGHTTTVLTEGYGQVSALRWLTTAESSAAIDDADAELRDAAEYAKRLDDSGELVVDGSWHRMLLTRVA